MVSTSNDLLKWSRGIEYNLLLSDSMTIKMFTPVTFRHYEGYAYGWYVGFYEFNETQQQINYHQHSGGLPGHTTLITRLPDEDYFIVLLNNTGYAKLELINYEIIRSLHGYEWEMRKDLCVELNKCVNLSQVKKIKKDFYANEDDYFESGNQISGLGYQKITGG